MFDFIGNAFHAVTHFVADNWRQILVIGAAVAVGVLVTVATGGLGAPLVVAALAGGLAAGGTSYTLNWALTPDRPAWSWGDFAKATIVSGVLAVATAGIGALVAPVASSVVSSVVPEAVSAAVPDAVSSALSNAAAGSALGAGQQVVLNAVEGRPLGEGVLTATVVGGTTGAVVGPVADTLATRFAPRVPDATVPTDTTPPEPTLPREYAGAPWKTPPGELFGGGVVPAHATQGQLGDCYLISSLASVADDQPGVIQNIIRLNSDGHYEVALTDPRTGQTTTTTLTSALPFKGNTTIFAGAGPGDTQTSLWPAMLEKAYAVKNGGYDGIGGGGWPGEALTALTGQPAHLVDVTATTPDQVWATLTASDKNDWPTVVSTPKGTSDALVHGSHSYSFLGTETAPDGARSVVLRNPWGYDPTPDGVFRMPLDRFMSAFNRVEWVEYKATPVSKGFLGVLGGATH